MPRQPAGTRRIHVPIPVALYDRLIDLTGSASEHYHGRVYGALSQIVTLALTKYLAESGAVPSLTDLIVLEEEEEEHDDPIEARYP